MKLKSLIGLMLLLPLVAFAKPVTTSDLEIPEQSYTMQIDYFADLYGSDSSIVKKVVQCESQYNPTALGDGGRSKGIAQFQEETFTRMSKILGEELDYHSSHDQLKLLSFAMSRPELAREWTSWRAIQNGGKYSFYSNQLKRHFVVYCK